MHFRSLLPEAAVRLQQSKAVLDRRRSHVLDRLIVSCPHDRCWHACVAGRRTRGGDHPQPQRGGRWWPRRRPGKTKQKHAFDGRLAGQFPFAGKFIILNDLNLPKQARDKMQKYTDKKDCFCSARLPTRRCLAQFQRHTCGSVFQGGGPGRCRACDNAPTRAHQDDRLQRSAGVGAFAGENASERDHSAGADSGLSASSSSSSFDPLRLS